MINDLLEDLSLYEKFFTLKALSVLNSEKSPVIIKEGNHQVIVKFDGDNNDASYSYDVNTSVIRDDAKGFYGVVTSFKDITEAEKLKQKLVRKESLLAMGEMAASAAAHEIKNPLFSIRGFLQLLEESLEKEDERREYTEIMLSELDRLHRLIEKFLSFSKEGVSKKSLIDINSVVHDVIKLFKPRLKLSNIKCHFKKSNEKLVVQGNCDQLRQVFINILQNCYEAIEPGKNIYVTSKAVDKQCIIIIKDEGKGICKKEMSQIFQPFFTTKEKGTGLGLFITKKIIKNHNGKIEVDSEEGKGTRFTIIFPKD